MNNETVRRACHAIGMDNKNPFYKYGEKHFISYRNYSVSSRLGDEYFDKLESEGLAEADRGKQSVTYYLTENGIRQMAVLYGECLIAYEAILRDRKNLDAITRKGFDLHFMDSEGKISNWGYSGIKDRESALQRFHEYHEMDPDKYARAIIRDNMTRKEKTYA